jgi:biotin carboxylase
MMRSVPSGAGSELGHAAAVAPDPGTAGPPTAGGPSRPHVVLVGAFGHVARQFLEAAREHACEISFVHEPDKVTEAHRGLVERVVDVDDIADAGAVIEAVRQLHAQRPVGYILSLTEFGVESAAAAAEALGISTPASLQVTQTMRSKHRMREVLSRYPELYVRSALCGNLGDALEAAERFGYPVIVKPDSAWGSLAVRRVDDEPGLREAFDGVRDIDQPVLVEEFLAGPEYSIEAFSQSGKHRLVAVTAKAKLENFIEIGHVVPGVPEATADEFAEVLGCFLDAVGLTDGNTHTEVIVTPAAGVRIVESHNRPGGDSIPYLVELATGVRLGRLALLAAIGWSDLPWNADRSRGAAIAFWTGRAGTVESVPEFDEEVRERCAEISLSAEVGKRATDVLHSFDRLGYVIGAAQDGEQAFAWVREVIEAHPVVITPDQGEPDSTADLARVRRYARGQL